MIINIILITLLIYILLTIFYFLNLRTKFYIFSLSILYPFVISIGPINEFPLYLIITPLFFLSIINLSINTKIKLFTPKSRLFIFALLILLVWAAISFFANPFTLDLNDHDSKMIVSAYLTIAIGILIFFSMLCFFAVENLNENNFLIFIILSSLIFGSTRVTFIPSPRAFSRFI